MNESRHSDRTAPDFELRPATPADVDRLLELRQATMLDHLRRAHAPHDDAAMRGRVMAHFEHAELVFLDSEFAGLLKAYRDEQGWRLVQVQIWPHLQGRGLGAALVRHVLERGRRDHCPVRLEVLKDSPARRLYERLGFEIVGEGELEYRMAWRP
jgi:ribosomal protein S18 acetylase RimI-like enzyme